MPSIDSLLTIMARLRDPEDGCPWDLEQDFASISPHTIEEAYEVDDAIARGDLDALRDELGDLLFQVVFQSRLAEEQGAFAFDDVVEAIAGKLVRRHPHVFAGAETPSSAKGQWEAIKAGERAAAAGNDDGPPDPFAGIPRRLPALARSAKIAGRIETSGMAGRDAADPEAALRSAVEDVLGRASSMRDFLEAEGLAGSEGASAPGSAERDASEIRHRRRELVGQGLAAWVRLARRLEIDPEMALRGVDDDLIAKIRSI